MEKKKIAFICVHNSCRSQIAEACGRCSCNITSDAGLWCESDLRRGWNRFI